MDYFSYFSLAQSAELLQVSLRWVVSGPSNSPSNLYISTCNNSNSNFTSLSQLNVSFRAYYTLSALYFRISAPKLFPCKFYNVIYTESAQHFAFHYNRNFTRQNHNVGIFITPLSLRIYKPIFNIIFSHPSSIFYKISTFCCFWNPNSKASNLPLYTAYAMRNFINPITVVIAYLQQLLAYKVWAR